jgi:hypothetical protein
MTLRDWAILLKVARGEADVPWEAVKALVTQGLVQRTDGVTRLTGAGRVALGLAEQRQKTSEGSPPRRSKKSAV